MISAAQLKHEVQPKKNDIYYGLFEIQAQNHGKKFLTCNNVSSFNSKALMANLQLSSTLLDQKSTHPPPSLICNLMAYGYWGFYWCFASPTPLPEFHRLRKNKKWGPSPTTILQIYKQCVRPIFEYGIVSTVTVSESVIDKIRRVQNSFIRLPLPLPTYVSVRLIHEALGLLYGRERLITVVQAHLARMHANPLVEHKINSSKTSIA